MSAKSLIFSAAVSFGALVPSALEAQVADESRMSLSLFGGIVQSSADLWSIESQRVGLLNFGGTEISVDSFSLARQARPGFVLGINGTYFPNPRFGYSFELSLFDPALSTDCSVTFDSRVTNTSNPNRSFCADIGQRKISMSTVNITTSGLFRPFPNAFTQPYFKFIAGFSDVGAGSTEVVGRFNGNERVLVFDQGAGFQPTLGFGVGVVLPVAPGYGARMELRDHLYRVRALDGAADWLAIAPSSLRWTHNVALMVGVDIVLQKKRGRRY
jgi:hypothetical protein